MARTPTLTDLLDSVVKYHLNDVHTCLPCTIVAYDDKTMKATVQPLIKQRYADADHNEKGLVDMPPIVGVPVVQQGNASFSITHPVKKGDVVVVFFFERSVDNWTHSDGTQPVDPQDYRSHSYSDAVAVTGLYPFQKAVGSDSSHLKIRANIGTANESTFTMKSSGDIQIDTPQKIIVNATGNAEITTQADAVVNVSGSTTLNSSGVTINSDVQVNGTLTASTDVIGGGKSLKNHKHDTKFAKAGIDTLTSESPT